MVACVSLSVVGSLWLRRYLRQKKMEAKELPDENEMPRCLSDIISDKDIRRIDLKDVKMGKVIGRGAVGMVTKAVWSHNGEDTIIAVKQMNLDVSMVSEEEVVLFLKEIKLHSRLNHE